MPSGLDAANRLYTLVQITLGNKVTDLVLRSTSSGVEGVLYDAFVFSLSLDDRYGSLSAKIFLQNDFAVTTPFGIPFTKNPDEASVRGVLKQMDEWARLRLPDKYLERFDPPTSQPAEKAEQAPEPETVEYHYFAQITYRNGVRVPVRVFRTTGGQDEIYGAKEQKWIPDAAGMLREDRLGVRDHEIWPVTRLQAGQVIRMIKSGDYRPLDIPGIRD